jgi:NADH:ubiquinone oxidoreductase subunit 5 (subunit L)/multisubunit Na+/H+ antiporter MnhA subunit
MEGPTPVSSLIHAATMVTAGIFLIIRFSHLFHDIPSFFLLFIVVGSITASSSATIGLFQTDIKKVVAYSTRSQLGYMFVCRGFSAYTNSMFHPFNHAFFKALLFPTAGYIIHSVCDEQDVRKLGSFLKLLPVSYITLLIGSMSLVGFPFMSGFYSKDKIIELVSNNYWVTADIVGAYKYIVFAQPPRIFAAICTIVYSFKLLSNVFSNSFAGFRYYVAHVHFSPHILLLPLLALAIPSTCSGYVTPDMMVGIGSGF